MTQNIRLWLTPYIIIAAAFVGTAGAGENKSVQIKVDQVGYPSGSRKLAMVTAPAKTFEVKRRSDNTTVFNGELGVAAPDADSGDTVQIADFSKLREPGTYYLDVPGVGESWTFAIQPAVFTRTYYLTMRGFYGQRCGTAVDLGPEFPGYTHAACHLKGEFHASSGRQGERDNVGGWHDAGDYGRYVVNSGISTGTLLWTWEIFGPEIKSIKLNIPESGNGTPDILNEARWNLQWMLKMQDKDGGVWHKQSSTHFSGFIMPEDDRLPSVVIGTGQEPYKSTCATADLAAVAAIAARVYSPFDAKFAEQNLQAARQAWLWTEKYPNVTFRNPPGISTGEYGDDSCADERLWAAAELWRTTGEKPFNDYVVAHYQDFRATLDSPAAEGWKDVAPRGSNGVAATYGLQLLIANLLTPDPSFVQTALDDLHYLLGRNTFSISWVTQVGENPYHHPHHRPSGADNNAEPWPGLLSGGPNAGRQDAVLRKLPPDLPPAKVYVDNQWSYASNEIAINWQASLVFLLAGMLPE